MVIAGLALDNHLPSLGLPSSAVEARVQAKKRKRRDPDLEDAFSKEHGSKAPKVQEDLGKLFGLEGKWATHARRKLLVRYLLASRRWFSSCRAVGMAVDASRVGGWETLRGLVCARQPGGASFRAALLPPQDRGGEGNKNRGGTTTTGEKSKTHENPRKTPRGFVFRVPPPRKQQLDPLPSSGHAGAQDWPGLGVDPWCRHQS